MRALAVSVLMALALTACSKSEAPPESAPPPATETAPAPTPEPAPAPEQTPPTAQPSPPPPPPEAAPAPPTTETRDDSGDVPHESVAPPPAKSSPTIVTRSLRRPPVATPVIVPIIRTDARAAANGGSSVVLFSDGAANSYRNGVTCVNIWNLMDTATTQEVHVGIRKADDGTVEALRPLYWMNKAAADTTHQTCAQRLANYDFPRAKTIRTKYNLTNAGPYFVVARADEQAAAIIDLTGKTDREIADLVRYFRDGFAFQNDIWDPSRNDPTKKRSLLVSFFGARFRESFMASLGFVAAPSAHMGCRLGDLADAPCT